MRNTVDHPRPHLPWSEDTAEYSAPSSDGAFPIATELLDRPASRKRSSAVTYAGEMSSTTMAPGASSMARNRYASLSVAR
jgi:hypothetical protein